MRKTLPNSNPEKADLILLADYPGMEKKPMAGFHKAVLALTMIAVMGLLAQSPAQASNRFEPGVGTGQEAALDFRAMKQLAEEGDAYAQHELGMMYLMGRGIEQDHNQAAIWFRRAAFQGHLAAQFSLGMLYESGISIRQDYEQALGWYTQAALQGDPNSQFRLGLMYQNGQGTEQDLVFAHMWLSLADEGGSKSVGPAILLVSGLMSDQQLLAAEQRLDRWRWKITG